MRRSGRRTANSSRVQPSSRCRSRMTSLRNRKHRSRPAPPRPQRRPRLTPVTFLSTCSSALIRLPLQPPRACGSCGPVQANAPEGSDAGLSHHSCPSLRFGSVRLRGVSNRTGSSRCSASGGARTEPDAIQFRSGLVRSQTPYSLWPSRLAVPPATRGGAHLRSTAVDCDARDRVSGASPVGLHKTWRCIAGERPIVAAAPVDGL